MQKDDVAPIAAGLTEEDRRAILELREDGRTGAPKAQRVARSRILRSMPNLVTHKWAGDCYKYFLTPLGLAVRSYLMENLDAQ